MNLALFSLIAIPFALSNGILYGQMKIKKFGRWDIIAKCSGSLIYVVSAGLALYFRGENPFLNPAMWFPILCTIADGLLELSFIPGMLVFGAAHVLLIVWMLPKTQWLWLTLVIWAVFMLLAYILYRNHIREKGRHALFYVLYAALLIASLAVAVSLALSNDGLSYNLLAAGAILFFISDMFVAKGHFAKNRPWQGALIMTTYWGALYLISSSLWLGT